MWYSLDISTPGKEPYNCQECTEKKRTTRNCHNRKGLKDSILLKSEWQAASGVLSALKIGEVKFYQCPISVITNRTWEISKIVNRTTDSDCNILMPYRGTSYDDQPAWYFQAVDIVRHARATHQRAKNG